MNTTTRLAQPTAIKLAYQIRYYDAVGRQLGQAKISYARAQTANLALAGSVQSAQDRNSNIRYAEVVCVYA